ncbi:MAG: hypothetical protein Q8R44_18905 [Novosphingobium sp.]|nr:hypothetical protein [Novosphingobium sp.]
MTEGTNSFAMKWVFYGSVPENVRQLMDDQIDFSFNDGGKFSPVLLEAIQWNFHSDFKYDYELGYWDNGVCALFERIGGIDALASLVKEANPLRRTLHITRRATETDIVDGPGPFSQDSEYFTINLSEKTLSRISVLGLDLFITYRVPR